MDEIDITTERMAVMEADGIKAAQHKASNIPKGEPGDCDECGEYFARLVDVYCGYCRDRRIGLIRNRVY